MVHAEEVAYSDQRMVQQSIWIIVCVPSLLRKSTPETRMGNVTRTLSTSFRRNPSTNLNRVKIRVLCDSYPVEYEEYGRTKRGEGGMTEGAS